MITDLVSLAWLVWNVTPIPTIVIDQDLPSGYYAMANLDQGECTIWIDPSFYEHNKEQQLGIVIHESGHCLGLEHTDQPSVMRDPTYWTKPTDYDSVRLRQIRSPFRLFITF